MYMSSTRTSRPAKDKITICICETELLFFWINTEPRSHGIGQFLLQQRDHAALSHDCYLDCSRVTTFPAHELRAAEHRRAISRELASRIVVFITTAPPKTPAPRYLKIAIANLSAPL